MFVNTIRYVQLLYTKMFKKKRSRFATSLIFFILIYALIPNILVHILLYPIPVIIFGWVVQKDKINKWSSRLSLFQSMQRYYSIIIFVAKLTQNLFCKKVDQISKRSQRSPALIHCDRSLTHCIIYRPAIWTH